MSSLSPLFRLWTRPLSRRHSRRRSDSNKRKSACWRSRGSFRQQDYQDGGRRVKFSFEREERVVRNERRALALALGRVDIRQKRMVAACCQARFLSRRSRLYPRHSRESGNPDGGERRRYAHERAMSTRPSPYPVNRLQAGMRIVRIRIRGIIGFSGFRRLVFDLQALIRIRFALGGISGYGEKRKLGESKS